MDIFKNEEGLTLVETIIALVLMFVLMAAFAGAMVVGLQSEVEVDKRLEASNLASSVIEYLGEGENLDVLNGDHNFNGNNNDNSLNLFIKIINNEYRIVDDQGDHISSLTSLNDDLFFDGIILGTDEGSSTIIIDEYNGIEGLYEVIINIEWLDRGNNWSNKLVTLLAVD